jgi:hypothetical protein
VQVAEFGIGQEPIECFTIAPLDEHERLTWFGIAKLGRMLRVHPERDDTSAVAPDRLWRSRE